MSGAGAPILPLEGDLSRLLVQVNSVQQLVTSISQGQSIDSIYSAMVEGIRTELGYEDLVEIEDAIRRTIAWEQRNPPSALNPQQFDYRAEDAALANVP